VLLRCLLGHRRLLVSQRTLVRDGRRRIGAAERGAPRARGLRQRAADLVRHDRVPDGAVAARRYSSTSMP
jgi:hypothetical protein